MFNKEATQKEIFKVVFIQNSTSLLFQHKNLELK
jgi:hypothetical protein